MTYLSARTHKRKAYTRYVLAVGIFLIIVLLWPFVKKYAYPIIEPAVIGYGATKQSLVFFPEFFRTYVTSHRDLVAKQKELESTLERLENTVAEQDAFIRENVPEESGVMNLLEGEAPIIMYPLMQDITRLYSTMLLSKGFKDGVVVGKTVYMRGFQAVCIIKEVYTSTSLCTLLSSSLTAVEGVTSSSSITLLLTGRGGHFLANVARDTPVVVGEKVYMRSDQKMLLGVVKQVMNNNQDTSWHVFVESVYNPVTSSIFYVQP